MARWVQLDLVEMSLGRRELSLLVISPHVKCCYTRVCTGFVQLIGDLFIIGHEYMIAQKFFFPAYFSRRNWHKGKREVMKISIYDMYPKCT